MAMNISTLSFESFEYKPPFQLQNGQKMSFMTTKHGSTNPQDKLTFQLCQDQNSPCFSQFGLSTPMPGASDARRNLQLQVPSEAILGFLQALDYNNMSVISANSEQWFKKQMTIEEVEAIYNKMVRYKDDSSSPNVVIKIKCSDPKRPTNVYVVTERRGDEILYEPATFECLTPGCRVVPVVEAQGLYYVTTGRMMQCGMSLIATDVLVFPNEQKVGMDIFHFTPGTTVALNTIGVGDGGMMQDGFDAGETEAM